MEEYDNQFKITCQHFNGFLTCKVRSVELIYITFLHAGFSTLGIYTDELDPEIFYFQWPARTKMQIMYQNFPKEGNGNYKFLICTDLQDNNFEVLRSTITLDKTDLDCAENVKAKSIGNYSGFITYSNTIRFSSKLLDNSGYLINQWKKIVKVQAVTWINNWE